MNTDPSSPNHISRRQLFRYFENGLPDAEAMELEEHLADCQSCVLEARRVRGFIDVLKGCTPPVPASDEGELSSRRPALLRPVKEAIKRFKTKARHMREDGFALFTPTCLAPALSMVIVALIIIPMTYGPASRASLDTDRPALVRLSSAQRPQPQSALNFFAPKLNSQPTPVLLADAPEATAENELSNLCEDMHQLRRRVAESKIRLADFYEEQDDLIARLTSMDNRQAHMLAELSSTRSQPRFLANGAVLITRHCSTAGVHPLRGIKGAELLVSSLPAK